MTATDLRSVLAEHLDSVAPPSGDLERAISAGRGIRRRRRRTTALAVAGTVGLCGAIGAVGIAVLGDDGPDVARDPSYASVGDLDFSEGVRAYADPGVEIHLGGRSFSARDLEYLDTDAAATPYGVVFFDSGRPLLLNADGHVLRLVEEDVDFVEGFHPTAKADAVEPLVAWATLRDGVATLTVRDMETEEDVATAEIDCGACRDLVIDGIDGGVVFVRDGDGTRTWDSATGEWADFAGPRTRVADVRSGVVLYSGPAPTSPGDWQVVNGPIDSELSYDGRYVRGWSSRLEPVDPDDEPIVLEQGPVEQGDGLGFWAFDTDGSVLVATTGSYPDFTVYDCVLPSGECTELGPLSPTAGDPMFIGVDM